MRTKLLLITVFFLFAAGLSAQEKAVIILKSGFSNICYIHSMHNAYVLYSAEGLSDSPLDSVLLSDVQSISFAEHFGEPLKSTNDSVRVNGPIFEIDPFTEKPGPYVNSIQQEYWQKAYRNYQKKGKGFVISAAVLYPTSILFGVGPFLIPYNDEVSANAVPLVFSILIGIPSFIAATVLLPAGMDRKAKAKAIEPFLDKKPELSLGFKPSVIQGSFGSQAYGAGITLNF